MIRVNLILKDNNLLQLLKSKIKVFLNNDSRNVIFVEENYVKEDSSNEILVLFYEICDNGDILKAKALKESSKASCIILLSEDESLVFQSLRVNPLQFIRINNFDEDFKTMVEIFLEYLKNNDTVVTLKSGTATLRLNSRNIIFIESFGHYLIIHSTTGEYQVREKLSNIIEQISNPSFIRTHKSYIVNINFVERILSDKVILKDKAEIPIGRNFKNEVIQGYHGSAEF